MNSLCTQRRTKKKTWQNLKKKTCFFSELIVCLSLTSALKSELKTVLYHLSVRKRSFLNLKCQTQLDLYFHALSTNAVFGTGVFAKSFLYFPFTNKLQCSNVTLQQEAGDLRATYTELATLSTNIFNQHTTALYNTPTLILHTNNTRHSSMKNILSSIQTTYTGLKYISLFHTHI